MKTLKADWKDDLKTNGELLHQVTNPNTYVCAFSMSLLFPLQYKSHCNKRHGDSFDPIFLSFFTNADKIWYGIRTNQSIQAPENFGSIGSVDAEKTAVTAIKRKNSL